MAYLIETFQGRKKAPKRNGAHSHKQVVGECDEPVRNIRQSHHLHHSPEFELFFVNNIDQNDGHGQLYDPNIKKRSEQRREVEVESVLGLRHLLHA